MVLSLLACNRQSIAEEKPDGYEGNYVVSFISTGAGINGEMYLQTEQFVLQFNSDHIPPVEYSIITWGREGEKDFCFLPNSSKHFYKLKQELEQFLDDAVGVRITEHTTCRESR